jgi:serine O-acetyltransferase
MTQMSQVFSPFKQFFELVAGDAKACDRRPSMVLYMKALLGPSRFSSVFLFRVDSALHDKGLPWSLLAKLARRWNRLWNNFEISEGARIGPGMYLPHPFGVVIGRISAGSNLIILQNATFGLKDIRFDYQDSSHYPRLGDNVTVGAGAAVLGNIAIGDGAVIGANAVVITDVPAGCRAVGNPARVIPPRTSLLCTSDAELAFEPSAAIDLRGAD